MYVYKSRTLIEVWAPAKLNLFLEVLDRRSDGFHEIETLMVPIQLFDTLYLQPTQHSEIELTCSVVPGYRNGESQIVDVPSNRNNLVYKALNLLRETASVSAGIRCDLVKRIPSAAGMGGGSSDAAGALIAANQLWDLGLSIDQLAAVAEKLGSDIPFFLYASTCVCRGRGELIEPFDHPHPLHLVVVKPAVGLSTADVYRATKTKSKTNGSVETDRSTDSIRSIDSIQGSMARGHVRDVSKFLFNRLQVAATSLSPEVAEISRRFNQLDVLGHQMSGSGSSYFAICRSAKHAKQTAAKLKARGNERVFATQTIGNPLPIDSRISTPSHN